MGLRFRKSMKIAPGVKVNFNKKSVGVTVGGKGAHYTVNSTGKKTASVGIPGTGLSYSTSSGGGSSNSKSAETKTTTSSTSSETPNESSNEKKTGCGTCLIWCVVALLVIKIYSYAWIPGIIATVYLALQKNVEKKYKIRRVLVALAVVLSSLIVLGVSNSEPTLTDISVKWSQEEYDINDTPELEIIATPADATIDSLSISDNEIATLKYADGKAIISFKAEGTDTIFFTANDSVTSDSTTIAVIDKVAEAERKAAEEEAQRLAEEEAQRKAEEEAAALAAQQTQEQQEEMVWIPSSGSKYHSRSGCSGMENPTEVTLSDAKARGYTACQRCH